jgi:hypothetical protein
MRVEEERLNKASEAIMVMTLPCHVTFVEIERRFFKIPRGSFGTFTSRTLSQKENDHAM